MARKPSKKGAERHLNLQCKQCTREAKVDGTEERVPLGAYRSTASAAKVKKERIVLERGSGPRSEARMEERGKRKVAKVTPEFVGAVGNLDTSRRIAPKELKQKSERCRRRQR